MLFTNHLLFVGLLMVNALVFIPSLETGRTGSIRWCFTCRIFSWRARKNTLCGMQNRRGNVCARGGGGEHKRNLVLLTMLIDRVDDFSSFCIPFIHHEIDFSILLQKTTQFNRYCIIQWEIGMIILYVNQMFAFLTGINGNAFLSLAHRQSR